MKKQWIIACIVPLLLAGCAGGRYVAAEPGERLAVTAGYDPALNGLPIQQGDEFVFSFVPPAGSDWSYRERRWVLLGRYEPINDRGYITVYGTSDFFSSIMFRWSWVNGTAIRRSLEGSPNAKAGMPWYMDTEPEIGARVHYIPRENQIQSGNWYRMGYAQGLFTDYMTKGAQDFFCRRAVYTRSGTADWHEDEQVITLRAEDTAFNVVYHCPFRLVDGRSTDFDVRTGFRLSGQELASNPDAIDEHLERLDSWLEPTWQSLIIREDAYQFDAPEGAQQSVFCETDGYCW